MITCASLCARNRFSCCLSTASLSDEDTAPETSTSQSFFLTTYCAEPATLRVISPFSCVKKSCAACKSCSPCTYDELRPASSARVTIPCTTGHGGSFSCSGYL